MAEIAPAQNGDIPIFAGIVKKNVDKLAEIQKKYTFARRFGEICIGLIHRKVWEKIITNGLFITGEKARAFWDLRKV